MSIGGKPLHLPWNQDSHYWLCVLPAGGSAPAALAHGLLALGAKERNDARTRYVMSADKDWSASWKKIHAVLSEAGALQYAQVSIVPGANEPEEPQVLLNLSTPAQIDAIAGSLWLGDALLANQVHCYLQPVLSGADKIFGYESFARVKLGSGEVIGGEAIVNAAHALSIEFAIDRLLHVQAIKTFVASHFDGFLFVNFFPGFIQRPDVYLEGISETVRAYGIVPKHVVLDLTKSETPRDLQHLKRVTEYCRTKGYAVALDDVESVSNARALVEDLRPDYVKLDMKLVARVGHGPEREIIREIVESCHKLGSMVLAEGVESLEIFNELKELRVDLFQGYYFSPPVPVEEVQKRGKGAA